MIRIDRGPLPPILAANAGAWTAAYATWLTRPRPKPSAPAEYRRPEIKEPLRTTASGKCVYCESEVTTTHWGDVEHLLPKAHRPELIVEWTNLAYVCAICNNKKSDYYDPAEPLVDPYSSEPRDFIEFAGPMCISRRGNPAGRRTILEIGLNRAELTDRRRERLQALASLIDAWALVRTTLPITADTFRREALAFGEANSEYSAACRDFIRFHTDWLDTPP